MTEHVTVEGTNSGMAGGSSSAKAQEVRALAAAARAASHKAAALSGEQRNEVLEAIAKGLEAGGERILAANALDVTAAEEMVSSGELSGANQARLVLNAGKLAEMVAQVQAVAKLTDPLGRRLDAMELDRGLELEKVTVPLGVVAVIFEARPDAVTQIAALAIKSGNAVLLKPGKEVERTAAELVAVIREAIAGAGLPADAVGLVLGRERVAELLHLQELVDLVIPRGSRALVEHVQAHTRIPVLGHADGICHVYVDAEVDAELALRVVEDAKTDYPAVCNAAETVLVHATVAREFLPRLAERLRAKGVALLGDEGTREVLAQGQTGDVVDWHTEYGDLTLAMRIVGSIDEAIEHIHRYGSAHTESICTTNAEAAARFLNEVDAATVMLNASTRFADGYRFGLGAEVGVSTSKIHARGPVGLEGLTTYKYVVRGQGHVVADYRGPGARAFTHRRHL